MIEYSKAIYNPAKYFTLPQEVVDSEDLTLEQKIAVLEQWRLDELDREVATEENMPSSDAPHMLRKVSLALRALRPHVEEDIDHCAPTKHGWVTSAGQKTSSTAHRRDK